MTSTMSGKAIDPGLVLSSLGIGDAEVIGSVGGGWDTAIWRVTWNGQDFALRLFRSDQVTTAERERTVITAAAAAGLPVPAVQAAGVWQGRPALLLTWCPGVTLEQAVRARPWDIWRLGLRFGRAQAAIHTCPPPAALLANPTSWLDWAGPAEDDLRARLLALAARQNALLHLDYHPRNVMMQGGRISGVLDWANAAAGDPRADLARTVAILRLAPVSTNGARWLERGARWLLEQAWRRGYQQTAGPIGDLGLFYAWAGAVMLRDLAPRPGRPELPLTERDMARIRRWTATWKRRCGLPVDPASTG